MLEAQAKAVGDIAQLFQDESSSGALEDVDSTLVSVSESTEQLFEKAEQDYQCR